MTYNTNTATFTVVDIRKTFESFQADLRMIARRTGKWTTAYVEEVCHDIVKLAEAHYLDQVDIGLFNSYNVALRATRYSVSMDGRSMKGDRAGGNDWPMMTDSHLRVILHYSSSWGQLSEGEKKKFREDNSFKVSWSSTSLDTTYSNLSKEKAQTYGSKGYELSKTNFK